MTQRVLAVDIGGTTTRVAAGDGHGGILGSERFSTRHRKAPESLVRHCRLVAAELLRYRGSTLNDISGLGVVVPGAIDLPSGTVRVASNLGWRNVPLGSLFEAAFNREAKIENDVNAAALGEWCSAHDAGEGLFVYLSIGTGIGAGFVVNGEVWHGRDGLAGEFGHTTIALDGPECTCGNRGCLEAMASGYALERLVRNAVSKGLISGHVKTPSELAAAAATGNEAARRILDDASEVFAVATRNLIHLLNPATICLGGGVIRGTDLFADIQRRVAADSFLLSPPPSLMEPSLGDEAGIVGALQIGARTTCAG